MAYAEEMPRIKDLIARLDVDVVEPDRNFHVYSLQNVQAEDLAEVLDNFLSDAERLTAETGTTGGRPAGAPGGGATGSGKSELLRALVDRSGDHLLDRRFAGAGRLPDLRQVVPDVGGVEGARDIARPGSDQLRPRGYQAHNVTTAPIVSDEVDGTINRLKLACQPGDVLIAGGAEAIRHRRAKPRRRERYHLVRPKVLAKLIPDGVGFRISVDEDDRHSTPHIERDFREPGGRHRQHRAAGRGRPSIASRNALRTA